MICIPIIAQNTDTALEKINRASKLADILEIRLDLMDTFDLHRILPTANKPVLVTYRSKNEGGKGSTDPDTYTQYALAALRLGADLVDVELWLPVKWRERIFNARGQSGIVVSSHIQGSTPAKEKLENILEDSIATSADVVKIVTRAEKWSDNFRLLDLIPKAHDRNIRIIAFCMGPLGRASRVLSHLMGGYMTFASLEAGEESADGQIPATEMKRILEILAP
jgi:3-dehydroquinate dehydratase type I